MPFIKFNELHVKKHQNCNNGKNISKMYNYLINLINDFVPQNKLNASV